MFKQARTAVAILLLFVAPALALNHPDSDGQLIDPVAPIYILSSAGTPQLGLSVTTGSAVALTVPTKATIAQICVETAQVRYRDDGTAPTASVGMPVTPGSTSPSCFQYAGPLSQLQFIAVSATATIDVLYYNQKTLPP
jgi:hypothetical protein